MIGYLQGSVSRNNGKTLLILVQGIGYEVIVPENTALLFPVGSQATIYTYLHVREEELTLYGFENEEKLSFFKLLLTVSGVGPKMGIEILSAPVSQMKRAIVEGEKSFLTAIKGVGDKIASRIILELKNKVHVDEDETTTFLGKHVNMDVVGALEHLGYDKRRVITLLKNMEEPIVDEEELLRYCLKHL